MYVQLSKLLLLKIYLDYLVEDLVPLVHDLMYLCFFIPLFIILYECSFIFLHNVHSLLLYLLYLLNHRLVEFYNIIFILSILTYQDHLVSRDLFLECQNMLIIVVISDPWKIVYSDQESSFHKDTKLNTFYNILTMLSYNMLLFGLYQ